MNPQIGKASVTSAQNVSIVCDLYVRCSVYVGYVTELSYVGILRLETEYAAHFQNDAWPYAFSWVSADIDVARGIRYSQCSCSNCFYLDCRYMGKVW